MFFVSTFISVTLIAAAAPALCAPVLRDALVMNRNPARRDKLSDLDKAIDADLKKLPHASPTTTLDAAAQQSAFLDSLGLGPPLSVPQATFTTVSVSPEESAFLAANGLEPPVVEVRPDPTYPSVSPSQSAFLNSLGLGPPEAAKRS